MKTKKLVRICLALLLVFFSLSSNMVVCAEEIKIDWEKNEKYCKNAFSSVSIGGKKVNLKDIVGGNGGILLKTKKSKVKVKVKLKNGWKLKKIYYYGSSGKEVRIKNGRTVKTKKILDDNLMIKVVKKKKSAELVVAIESGDY